MFRYFFKIILFFVVFTCISNKLISQNNYPDNYFAPPFKIPMKVSGTFGELRSNHFHSGIDLRIGRVGLPYYSIADGYVSRIKVSAWGYGRAIYITHPNGYKSVYGHMDKFNNEIEKYVKRKQIELQSFGINVYPQPDELPLNKGDYLGNGGNSGYSFGPHLHFEIRKAKGDIPINPLLCYPKIKDTRKPAIKTLEIFGIKDSGIVNSRKSFLITPSGRYGKYKLNNPVYAWGKIAFGVEAYDYIDGIGSRNSVYSVELHCNNEIIYKHIMNEFSFYESRYINSLINYKERITSGKRIQRTYIEEQNKLSIYKKVKNRGFIDINQNKKYNLKYIIKDIKGNTSVLEFTVVGKKYNLQQVSDYELFMKCDKDNYYITDDFRLSVYKGCIYDDLKFRYNKKNNPFSKYSKLHDIHNEYIPVHYPMTLSIKIENLDTSYHKKALIAQYNRKGKVKSKGGKHINGFITTQIKEFGNYFVAIDTIAPIIVPINIYSGAVFKNDKTIKLKITDNLTDIKKYNGYINNNWVVFEYDGKNDLFTYYFDKNIINGKNELKFYVEDEKGNQNKYIVYFFKY